MIVCDGILYHTNISYLGDVVLLLVDPLKLRSDIFDGLHRQRYSGHLGRDRTVESIKRLFHLPGLSSDVAR
ncbi:hypothetical protein DPMN_099241 [Dreissena polymorpha]|uniref:Integrase zinc-binding domain-containing protein n=1 Tax=Dreissena polymorpha TaxID=45954 RepID=A0A9D4R6D9_DREPO|nr:hypothetical protein DPMN_099241 [Dreissena polymorpha]